MMQIAKKQSFVFQDFKSYPGANFGVFADNEAQACDQLIENLSGVVAELRELQNHTKAAKGSN